MQTIPSNSFWIFENIQRQWQWCLNYVFLFSILRKSLQQISIKVIITENFIRQICNIFMFLTLYPQRFDCFSLKKEKER